MDPPPRVAAVPGRLPVVPTGEPDEVDPPTLGEEFPVVPAAPGVRSLATDAISTKSEPVPRSTQPISVIGVPMEPVPACVPGRAVVSVRAPDVAAPGCCVPVVPGCCDPLCTGDCVGVWLVDWPDATEIDSTAAAQAVPMTRVLICSSGLRCVVAGGAAMQTPFAPRVLSAPRECEPW